MSLIDSLVKMILEYGLDLNDEALKNKIEEIEACSTFYNENLGDYEYKEYMGK